MKRLLLLMFFPLVVIGQTGKSVRAIDGPFANRPVCSRDAGDSNAHYGDEYRDTDDDNAYKCLSDGWRIFGTETTDPANSISATIFNAHQSDVGSTALIDIRAHGGYAKFASTTCSTRRGSALVTLGVASNFRNGEYATCFNAGAPTTAASQSIPTVIPSVHDGGMTATADNGGSTSYAYEVLGEDAYNGRSAASAAGTTSKGAATLGKVGNTFRGCIRYEQTVTCTTGAPHGFIPGMQIWVAGMTDPTFNGNWVTVSPTNGTTVTWRSGWDTRNGATGFSSVANRVLNYNVWGWKMNRVSWKLDPTSYRHHIYGPNCPTTCYWLGQTMLDYWDDYGSTMGANQTRPPYIPSVAPMSPANQHFTFQIKAGAGTTTLTASTNAGGTQAASVIVSDVGPAILASCTAASAPGTGTLSSVEISNVGIDWQVNSYTNLYNKNCSIVLNGSNLLLNQPLDNAAAIIGTGSASVGSFGWAPSPKISGIGYPLISQSGGGGTVPVLKNLYIYPQQPNGGLGIYETTPINLDWDTIYLLSSPGSNSDCIGQAVVFQNITTGFFWNIYKFTFAGGACEVNSTQYTGDSPVPFFTSTGPSSGVGAGSGLYLKQGWFINRGGVNLDYPSTSTGGENTLTMERYWTQNNTVPAASISGPLSSLTASIRLVDGFTADFATPQFVNYGTFNGTLIVDNVSPPNNGMSVITGNPLSSVTARNTNSGVLGTDSQSMNQTNSTILADGLYSVAGGAQALFQVNEHIVLGAGFSLFTNALQPAAPTCSVATAGPPYTEAGTWYISYAPVWQNGGIGTLSAPSASACSSNGTTQQITVIIPSAIPGAAGYIFYVNRNAATGGFGVATPSGGCSVPGSTRLSTVIAGNCGYSAASNAGGGPAGITNGNVYATDFVMGATPAPTGATTSTKLYMDSTAKWPAFKPNGNKAYAIPGISGPIIDGHNLCASGTNGAYVDCLTTQTITSGTAKLGLNPIEAKNCATVITIKATGVVTTDVVSYSFNAVPSGAFAGGLVIQSYVTPGSVNFLVCNPTENTLVPPAATLNWRVIR